MYQLGEDDRILAESLDTPGYLKGTIVQSHPMFWSLVLCPDDTKQDSMVYGAEFGVVFPEKGPRTASIQEGLVCLSLYISGLEGELDFRLVVELPEIPPDAHAACAGPTGDFNGHVRDFGRRVQIRAGQILIGMHQSESFFFTKDHTIQHARRRVRPSGGRTSGARTKNRTLGVRSGPPVGHRQPRPPD